MKLKIRIKEVAKSRGLTTAYQLQKKADLSPTSAARFYKNNALQLNLKTLEKLCNALDCTPNDLLTKTQ